MSDPQSWALIGLIGVFATAVVTLMIFGMTSLRSEMRAELRAEVGGLRAEMNARFDSLDRDVQALMNHVFGRGT